MNADLRIAKQLLLDATALVPEEYFQMPVAGREDPIYRERVYCYELYHQMKLLWPKDWRFSLCGEVDKKNHRLIRGGALNEVKPDFLFHVPRSMRYNLLVVEVKPANTKWSALVQDWRKLCAFRHRAGYAGAYQLIYGDDLSKN